MANDMGKKLRELRDARGLTQREVANAVGVTEATVSRWESGHINNMRRDKIEGLAKVLHVSPLVIMGKDGDTPAPPAAQPPTAPYHPELTKRDERDIERRLDAIMNDLSPGSGLAFYDGKELTEKERDLLRISLKNSMELVRSMAKERFTPKKYKK